MQRGSAARNEQRRRSTRDLPLTHPRRALGVNPNTVVRHAALAGADFLAYSSTNGSDAQAPVKDVGAQ